MQSIIKKTVCAAVLTLLSIQIPAFATNLIQPYKLVSMPTAEILPRAYLDVEMNYYASRAGYGSGLLAGLHVGLTNRLMFGVSYGGEGLIGHSGDIRLNTFRDVIYPGVLVKYRLVEEGAVPPAVTLGFDNQGYGGMASEGVYGYDGYIYKAPGFFAAASKSYMMMSALQIGFHGTLNWAIEKYNDNDWGWANHFNIMLGTDIAINEELMVVVEYDFAFNDATGSKNETRPINDPKYFTPLGGFLNIGVRWALTQNFHIQADFRDILENKLSRSGMASGGLERWAPIGWSRELKVIYVTQF
ncbi:MAG: hypothetical protein FWB85_09645 [Chitinispirillia bacterium]|nr:hypothetical protein [Chitinispirillia bacterium]